MVLIKYQRNLDIFTHALDQFVSPKRMATSTPVIGSLSVARIDEGD